MTISAVTASYSGSSLPLITPVAAPAIGSTQVLLSIYPSSVTHTTPAGWQSSRINHETGGAAQVLLWKNGANNGLLSIQLSGNAAGSLMALTSDDRQLVSGSIKTNQGPWNTYGSTVLPSQSPTASSSTACAAYSPSYFHRDAKSPTATKIATTVKNGQGQVILAEGQPSIVAFRKELSGTAASTPDEIWAFGAYDTTEPTDYTGSGDERWMVHGWLLQGAAGGITGGTDIGYLARPTNLAVDTGTLSWDYAGTSGLKVLSSASNNVNGVWTEVATLASTVTEYEVSPSTSTWYTVVAYSGDTESAYPDPVQVVLDPEIGFPVPSISTSSANVVAPGSYNITASATDSDGTIATVAIKRNGTEVASYSGPGPHVLAQTATTSAENGTRSYTAVATDDEDNVVESSAVNVVINLSSDVTPPVPTISASATTVTEPGTVTLSFSATDAIGVTGIRLYEFDGGYTQIGSTYTGVGPHTYDLTYSDENDNGTRWFAVDAFDAAGNVGLTQLLGITANLPTGAFLVQLAASSSTITQPGNIVFTATIEAGITPDSVVLQKNGVTIGAAIPGPPYIRSISFTSSADNGSAKYTARAVDGSDIGVSAPITVVCNITGDALPPTYSTGLADMIEIPRKETARAIPFALTTLGGSTPLQGGSPTVKLSKNGAALVDATGVVTETGVAGTYVYLPSEDDVNTEGDLTINVYQAGANPVTPIVARVVTPYGKR